MTISAIITTHDRADMVIEAVESVLAQTRPADEVIVVDDGSQDDTMERLQAFGSRLRCLRQPPCGVSAARNRGVAAAAGDWIAFLDSDDLWRPRKLARQVSALSRASGFSLCYTDEEWRRHGRWLNQAARHRKAGGWIYRLCLPLCLISPSSVLLHRRLLEEVGGFDESMPACEDYDLWLRVTCRYPVLFVPERLIIKRAGDWPQLSKQHSLDRYRLDALKKMADSGLLDESDRRATIEMLRARAERYARGCRRHGRIDQALRAEALLQQYGAGTGS